MSQEALWVSVSPTLKKFHTPLLRHLSHHLNLKQWEYQQSDDEPSSLDLPVTVLHDYLKGLDHPLHLLGHSTGGIVALLYAYGYPERVKSLTLLGVGINPLIDWHAHYYAYRKLLPCSREFILAQMVRALFGNYNLSRAKQFMNLLEADLEATPSPHSLMQHHHMETKPVPSPLLVYGSQEDVIVEPPALNKWNHYLKPDDCIWKSSKGPHFFHYHYPKLVGANILNFIQKKDKLN